MIRTSRVVRIAFPALLAWILSLSPAGSQSNRTGGLFSLQFRRAWDLPLNEPAKLIEIAPVGTDPNNRLILLVGGRNKDDYKRKLLVLKWNGLQFDMEYASPEFLGSAVDTLLAGPFLPDMKPAKEKRTGRSSGHQIVTTRSVFAVAGTLYSRLFDAPADIHAALFLDKPPARLVVGRGDNATAYEMNDSGVFPSTFEPPGDGAGYVRFGVGTQEPPLIFRNGQRYVQSHWGKDGRWVLCLQPGNPARQAEAPEHATVGDRLVVYTPRPDRRTLSFWRTRPEDLEEAWRSEPLSGRVLDVRVGDPRNDGQIGILVLTATNNDRDRHLHFFVLATGIQFPVTSR
ncbi:MAG: hypothetical protein RMJ43_14965 [Chloroherpetonaceae bacterium]|nr:hypothetical protein [Chthonomonadaceae bacterium]MDW8209133.1 hypothetical protein [Chloroherpetonaceae bacterium]